MASLPFPESQRAIFDRLQPDEDDENTSSYEYAVCQYWHHKWLKHIGKADGKMPGQTQEPGPVVMNIHDPKQNVWLPGHLWAKLIEMYGLSPEHDLDRRYIGDTNGKCLNSQKLRNFEICVLSPFSHLLEHRHKYLDMTEHVGYIECQIKHILKLTHHAKSRLWVCTKGDSKFRPMFDRVEELQFADGFEDSMKYILAIEVQTTNHEWPTGLLEEPKGTLYEYAHVTHGRTSKDKIIPEFQGNFESQILAKVISEVTRLVQQTGDRYEYRESEIAQLRKKLEKLIAKNEEFENTLNKRSQDLQKLEQELEKRNTNLVNTEAELKTEKEKFLEELQHIESMNKICDEQVLLNVGGYKFTTSTTTLCKDKNSMLAAMFSGRHPLQADKEGYFFIDRDGKHFGYILNYLRNGIPKYDITPTDDITRKELLIEADYFGVEHLHNYLTGYLANIPYYCAEHYSEVFGSLMCDCDPALKLLRWSED